MPRGSRAEILLTAAFLALLAPGAATCLADPSAPQRIAQADEAPSSAPRTLLPLRLEPEAAVPEDTGPATVLPEAGESQAPLPESATQPTPWDMPGDAATGFPPTDFEEPAVPDIEVGELAIVAPDSGGMLEESMGGLGIDMWADTPRSTIVRLLPQLPARHASPALHDLARRLLLSTAVVPTAQPEDPQASVMGLRVERLEAMGLVGAVVDMIALAPNRDSDPYLLRAAIDNRLLLGDHAEACEAAAGGRAVLPRLYWEQVTVFCQAMSGEAAAATLGANVLAESGELDDPAFFALAQALAGGVAVKLDKLDRPTPLHLAMATAAKVQLPSSILETDSPLILRALADNPAATPRVRLEAAERAALAGAIGPQLLAERYAALEFAPDELANAISRADGKRSATERALLYQAAQRQDVPAARAAAVRKALQVGAADGMYLLTARVYRPLLEAFEPGPDLAWFGGDAARALYVLGRPDLGDLWAETARRLGTEADERRAVNLLWPMARLADEVPGWREAEHERWIVALKESAGQEWTWRAGFAYDLLESFGEPVPDEHWSALMGAPSRATARVADPAYLRAFRLAAANDRRAEAALLAILLLGPSGVDGAAPDLVSEVIEGLTLVGLSSDARRLAIEAALAGGL